MVVTIIYL